MIEVVPFKAWHLKAMLKTGLHDKALTPFYTEQHGTVWEAHGQFHTALDDGKPVLIGGIVHYWASRGEAWLLFGKPRRETFIKLFKIVKRGLELAPYKRIEMTVARGFREGHRLAEILGFKKEAECLSSYLPDGRDVSLYALVRG